MLPWPFLVPAVSAGVDLQFPDASSGPTAPPSATAVLTALRKMPGASFDAAVRTPHSPLSHLPPPNPSLLFPPFPLLSPPAYLLSYPVFRGSCLMPASASSHGLSCWLNWSSLWPWLGHILTQHTIRLILSLVRVLGAGALCKALPSPVWFLLASALLCGPGERWGRLRACGQGRAVQADRETVL